MQTARPPRCLSHGLTSTLLAGGVALVAAGTLLTLCGGPADATVMSTLLRPVAEGIAPSTSGASASPSRRSQPASPAHGAAGRLAPAIDGAGGDAAAALASPHSWGPQPAVGLLLAIPLALAVPLVTLARRLLSRPNPETAWALLPAAGAADRSAAGAHRHPPTSARHATDTATATATAAAAGTQLTPITILAGFLGAGKTTTLKHLLENREGLRVGVIVNDVAAVNIDAELIKTAGTIAGADTVQLQNGCACCSIQSELLDSVKQLLAQGRFDHLVIELSGVAEPARVQQALDAAAEQGDKVAAALKTQNVVTLVDVSTFGELCISQQKFRERRELGGAESSVAEEPIATLLVEQIECANLVVLNKTDTISAEDLRLITEYVSALNKTATIVTSQYGRVAPTTLLQSQRPPREAPGHAHAHDAHAHDTHAHTHAHGAATAHAPDHDHDHGHQHSHACSGGACTDPSHQPHDHDHEHEHNHACGDPQCSDPTHHHHHDHSHGQQMPTDTTLAKSRFGIDTFVYQARRPFDAQRLLRLVDTWPVASKALLAQLVQHVAEERAATSASGQHPFLPLLRSKGFVWVTSNPFLRIEWVQAGKHFAMNQAGPWWATFSDADLRRLCKPAEYEDITKNQFQGEFGDRRNELVFIGIGLDKTAIQSALDECLLTDAEMQDFRKGLMAMAQGVR